MSPHAADRSLGVVGRGRAARSLVPVLRDAGVAVAWWWSRGDAGAVDALGHADTVLLCVPDGAIADVATALARRPSARQETWLHLSGARPADVARASTHTPAAVGCLHPLVALTGAPDRAHLSGATAGIDGDDDACAEATRLAALLGLVPRRLRPGTKALYHAAAVTVAGHATALFSQATALLERCGFDADTARATLQPLFAGAAANLTRGDASSVITGPMARGDVTTIAAHLAALDAHSPDTAATYRQLARTALALSAPTLAPETAAALAALLD